MTYTIWNIVLKDEYTGATQSFTRTFPNKIGDQILGIMEVFQIIDAEFNEPLRQQNCPINEISLERQDPWEYPQGHWYRDQMTNVNTMTV